MVRPVTTHNLEAVTADGSGDAINTRGHHKVTMVVAATGVSSGADIDLEGSADGTNWYVISNNNIAGSGVTEYSDANIHKHVRATVSSYVDGTYDVWLVLSGHAGSGGWADN
jgi:hypothetical protein